MRGDVSFACDGRITISAYSIVATILYPNIAIETGAKTRVRSIAAVLFPLYTYNEFLGKFYLCSYRTVGTVLVDVRFESSLLTRNGVRLAGAIIKKNVF